MGEARASFVEGHEAETLRAGLVHRFAPDQIDGEGPKNGANAVTKKYAQRSV